MQTIHFRCTQCLLYWRFALVSHTQHAIKSLWIYYINRSFTDTSPYLPQFACIRCLFSDAINFSSCKRNCERHTFTMIDLFSLSFISFHYKNFIAIHDLVVEFLPALSNIFTTKSTNNMLLTAINTSCKYWFNNCHLNSFDPSKTTLELRKFHFTCTFALESSHWCKSTLKHLVVAQINISLIRRRFIPERKWLLYWRNSVFSNYLYYTIYEDLTTIASAT